MTDFESRGLLLRPVPGSRPLPVLRLSALAMPGATGDPARRGGGHWPRRSACGIQGSRDLVVCGGRGTLSAAAVHARRATTSRALIEAAPRRDPDGRARRHDGLAATTPKTRGLLSQAHHAEAVERERRVHVAAGRPATRHVHRQGFVRVHGGLREAVRDARHRRPARRAAGGPRRVPAGCWATRSSARSARSDTVAHNPLEWLDDKFREYISDRRREPREDVLTELAAATYPDGSTPEVEEVVKLVDVPVRRGHGDDDETAEHRHAGAWRSGPTSSRRCATTARRSRRSSKRRCARRVPVKSHFRLARTTTSIGGVEVPAGTILMMLPGASNRDPREVRQPPRVPARPPQRARARRVRARARIRAQARRWRGRRRGSRSTGSSTGWPTSASTSRVHGTVGRPQLHLRPDVHHARAIRLARRVHAHRNLTEDSSEEHPGS